MKLLSVKDLALIDENKIVKDFEIYFKCFDSIYQQKIDVKTAEILYLENNFNGFKSEIIFC